MAEKKYYCYICGDEITDKNRTDEHIILNALGGHQHSYTIICKRCNIRMGESADARLAEDLSFFTDFLRVKKNRQHEHSQIMIDEDGHEVVVKDAGKSLALRKPYMAKEEADGVVEIKMTVRNMAQLEGILKGLIKRKDLTQEQADEVLAKAKETENCSPLSKRIFISTDAFPSIIKSAASFYVDRTHDIATVKPLVPYIEGKGDCKDVMYLHHFKSLPYPEVKGQVTHMIHIEGTAKTGLLYAMMEYYSIFVYIVVIDKSYTGNDINMTYTYDVVAGQEVDRKFTCPLTMTDLEDFKNLPYEEYVKYLPYIQKRADAVMVIWDKSRSHEELKDVIDKAFARFPDGCILTPDKMTIVEKDIVDYFKKLLDSMDLKKKRKN